MRPPLHFGARLERVKETPSTMDDACRLAEQGAPEGTAVVADVQTAGRGRAGRPWTSPPGGLYVSVVLRPAMPLSRWSLVPIAAGVALQDALVPYARGARLKWPNDVLVGGKKLAGILAEAKAPRFAVLGIGVNVSSAPLAEATSLAALGASVDPDRFARELLACLETRYAQLEAGDDEGVRGAWEARAGMLGARVKAEGVEGLALRLAEDGGLVVRTDDGIDVEVSAGDVAPS